MTIEEFKNVLFSAPCGMTQEERDEAVICMLDAISVNVCSRLSRVTPTIDEVKQMRVAAVEALVHAALQGPRAAASKN